MIDDWLIGFVLAFRFGRGGCVSVRAFGRGESCDWSEDSGEKVWVRDARGAGVHVARLCAVRKRAENERENEWSPAPVRVPLLRSSLLCSTL
jgi:hypothetical protein